MTTTSQQQQQQHSSLITLPEEIYESIYDTRWRLMNKVGKGCAEYKVRFLYLGVHHKHQM